MQANVERGSVDLSKYPIILGGMGVAVSRWPLAQAVAHCGQEMNENVLGVVSGVGLSTVIARLLQDGDQGGHIRRAFNAFPYPEMAEQVWKDWFIEDGRAKGEPYKAVPMINFEPNQKVNKLIICANFAEVWLAKQGHSRPIGINYLEKIQTPRLPELFGAMLAGVDVVLMGAGIPNQVPRVLDNLAEYQSASYCIDVDGKRSTTSMSFDPSEYIPEGYISRLKRPNFLAVISSNALAQVLVVDRKTNGYVDGFVIENHTAGGHKAPPRNKSNYGPQDEVNLEKMKSSGRPFWLAGSYASPQKLAEALSNGASGIQVGSIFALCRESGFSEAIKQRVIKLAFGNGLDVKEDPRCSPSGFPFNVVQLDGTMSDFRTYETRKRICDIGYLRQAYRTTDGKIAFRCPAEPVGTYLKRGGKIEDAEGRKCLCNSLLAAADLGQIRKGVEESPIVTLGNDTDFIRHLIQNGEGSYSVRDALAYLLGK